MPTHYRRLTKFLRMFLKRQPLLFGALLGLMVVSAASLVLYRTHSQLKIMVANQQSVQVAGPLSVDFGQELAAGFEASIEPKIEGSWSNHGTLLGTSGVSFKPKGRFEAGRIYSIRVTKLKRVLSGVHLPDIDQTFKVQTPPDIASISPVAGTKNVSITTQITVKLSAANRGVRDLQPTLTPAVPLKLVSSDDQTFVWQPTQALKQSANYTFNLIDGYGVTQKKPPIITVSFATVAEPKITSARTGGLFSPDQTVDIVFDQAMERSAGGFDFGVAGKGEWASDTTYRFKPEDLKTARTYSYKVKAGIKSKAGGVLEASKTYQFSTNGVVTASLSPGGSGVSVGSTVRVVFDQPVDHASAESRFKLDPATAGKFSWSGNAMTFKPNGLGYQTTYRISLAAGVAPKWGLASRAMSGSFTTVQQITRLNVPVYKQAYGRSCELASLRMLLAYRGIKVSDWDILMRIGYNPRARDGSNWDNPNQRFVGYVDTYSWSQGYGVHSGPIAAAARSYGRNASSQFGVSAAFIAANVHAGNPVEFWGHINPPHPDSWNTSSGVVQTTTSMHARVVYGAVGPPSNPVGFHIIDPWTGSKFYWTTAQLMANMNAALPASNQAVVVF